MKHGLPVFLAYPILASLFMCRPSLAAGSAADLWPVEAAVRKADADWAVAANTASVDAWLAFYAADAVVRLPNDTLASGRESLRRTVTRLLGLPRVSVAWRPINVEVAPSGDQALLLDSFELRFADSRGAPVSDRGRRLEIWKKQTDGAWKCIVDAWNLDEAIAAPTVAAPAPTVAAPAVAVPSVAAPSAAAPSVPSPAIVQGASPTVASAAPAQSAPSPAAGPETGPPKPAPATKYGEMPTYYQDTIRKYFLQHLKYPDSVQYREITSPEQGYTTGVTGTLLMRETRTYGWTVKATINAKNSPDTYVGFKNYTFLFRGEKIVDARLPLPGGEVAEPKPD
jgi:ketosteroid isomerase-like protein